MLRGIGRLRAGGNWSPLILFAGGEQGAWYESDDISTLFQDSAGATPVTATTQPVGRVLDKSPRGNNAIQAAAGSRPTWQQPTYYGIRADGTDDSLSCAAGGGGTAGFLLCAAVTINGGDGTERRLFGDHGSNTGYICRVHTTDKLQLLAGDGAAFTTAATAASLPSGETHVLLAYDDGPGGNLNVQIDNGTVASIARPAVSAGSAGFTMFKSNTAATSFFNGDCQAMVYVRGTAKTANERAMLKRYIGAKVGIAL